MRALFVSGALLASPAAAFGQAAPAPVRPVTTVAPKADPDVPVARYTLVEEFTADTLEQGEVKVGTDVEAGMTRDVMIGTDAVAFAVGASTIQAKMRVFERGEHRVSLGLRAAYLSKNTLLWGSVNEHFDELEARVVRPQISWTNELSPRLRLHTFWAKGFGKIKAKLSEKGRRKLWETKHPGKNYDERDKETQKPTTPSETPTEGEPPDSGNATDSKENQEKLASERSALTSQSIQVQSITGLAQERFQLTGEFTRASGSKVLVTSRIEQTQFEELKSNFFRLTAAHQWIWPHFQIRLGIGVQYYVLSGRDLDDEAIDESGVQPASDVAFYWRF